MHNLLTLFEAIKQTHTEDWIGRRAATAGKVLHSVFHRCTSNNQTSNGTGKARDQSWTQHCPLPIFLAK